MKTIRPKQSLVTAFAAVVLATSLGINKARADLPLATFDTDISANDGVGDGPGGPTVAVWDGTQNSPGSPAGGSEYVTVLFTSQGTAWQQCQLNFTQPGWPGTSVPDYINVEWDIKVDVANSHLGPNGNYGEVHPILQSWSDGSPGWDDLGGIQITNVAGWQHMKMSVASFSGHMTRFVFALISNGGNNITNTCAYWIDNIALTSAPLPPPTLASPTPAPKIPGLTLLPCTIGQYQRVMVYPGPLGTAMGWYNAGAPVTYSFTITNFPNVAHYTAQVFWIANAAMQYNPGDTSVDWNCTNDLVFSVSANAATPLGWGVTMAAKTNSPGALGQGNPNLTITNFSYGTLPVGIWTITFLNNTDFTITAPDNTVVSASLPSDVADIVSGNSLASTAMTVYFGIQPNDPIGIGKAAVFSNIKIKQGATDLVNDNFDQGYLDTTNTWSKLADYQQGIFVNNGDLAYFVSWNTPNDQGYQSLLGASSVNGVWQEMAQSSSWLLINGQRTALLHTPALQSVLGTTDHAYFRLIKREFAKLQVLFPGETNAPDTLTGKVGTPDPVSLSGTSGLVTVTVNAVDSTFHIVNSSDTVHLVTTDGAAITPADGGLVNGTVQMIVQFGTVSPPTYTVTASDVTDNTKTSDTSSPVTVNP